MILAIITVVVCLLGFPLAVAMAYLIEPTPPKG